MRLIAASTLPKRASWEATESSGRASMQVVEEPSGEVVLWVIRDNVTYAVVDGPEPVGFVR